MRKIIALIFRTFVTECPHCRKHFYGFHKYAEQVKIGHIHYRIVCHRCAKLGGKHG
jgi:hypothetical protein